MKLRFIIAFLMAFLISAYVFGQGRKERVITAVDTLKTQNQFVYQGQRIPVLDITYHEFSADSSTWRKNYVEGDCYIRLSNTLSGSAHTNWWGYNICNTGTVTNPLDTMFVYYYNNDTITYIDTIVIQSTIDIKIPAPDTITGVSTNFQDTATHTHALYIDLNDIQNVNATPTDGQVLKYNSSLGYWTAANDLIGGGGSTLTVQEQDGTPSVSSVNTIKVENGTVTNNGAGVVSIDFFQEAVDMPQDFYRAGEFSASAGDNFVDFTTAFSDNDYTLVQAYALYTDSTRQNLVYDSLAADGFRVIGVIGSSTIHYLAMRDLDSLGLAAENQGKVLASGSDVSMSYLNGAVDDSTIIVSNEELHVIPEFDSVLFKTDYVVTGTEPTGTVFWDTDEHTLSAKLEDVTLQIGREFLIYGKNLSGSIIYNGMAVSIAAATGSFTAFELTDISTQNAYAFAGLATEDIAINGFGYVTTAGLVHELDTDTLDEGKPVYVSVVPGVLTDTFPSPPNFIVNVGVTDYSHPSQGRINVIRSVVPRLENLSDVNGTPLSKTGQFPMWNETEGYFDFDHNLLDTTAAFAFDSLHVNAMTVDSLVAEGEVRFGYVHHAFGGFQDSSVTQTLTNQNDWYWVTNVENTLWSGEELDGMVVSNDTLTIIGQGDYGGSLSITFSGISGRDFQFRIYNVTQVKQEGYYIGGTATGTTNFNNVYLPIYIEGNAGDEYVMQMRCTSTAGATPILKSAVFYIQYLHE